MGADDVALLKTLRRAGSHLSPDMLAGETALEPKALALRLDELQQAGYAIERHPHLGIRFIAPPDRLIADDLTGMLEDVPFVRQVLVFEETTSTNDIAGQLGRQGAREGVVVFAERQTAGRGRLGRQWVSDARQGLWFSLLLRPQLPAHEWTRLTTWAAVGVARGLEAVAGVTARLKWPNDIQIGGRKITGILLEAFHVGESGFAVAGIGVNVNHTAFDPSISDRAISLRQAVGRPLDRQEVAVSILRHLDAAHAALTSDFSSILREARARSVLLGKYVEIGCGTEILSGIAEDLAEDGSLCLRDATGCRTTVSAGEVTVIRSAGADGR